MNSKDYIFHRDLFINLYCPSPFLRSKTGLICECHFCEYLDELTSALCETAFPNP